MIMASGNSLLPRDDDDDKRKRSPPSSWLNPPPHDDPAAAPTPYHSQSFIGTSRPNYYQINEQDRGALSTGGGEFLQRQWNEQQQLALLQQQQQQQHEQLLHWQQQQQRAAMTFGALASTAPLMMEPHQPPGGQPQPHNNPCSAHVFSSPSIDPELVHDLYRLLQGSAAGSCITTHPAGAAGATATTASQPTLLHRSCFPSPPTPLIGSPVPQLQGQSSIFPSSFVDNSSSFKRGCHNISLEDPTTTGWSPYASSSAAVSQNMNLLQRKSASASSLTNDLLRLRQQQQQQQQQSSTLFSTHDQQQQQQQQVVTHHPQPVRPRSSSLPFWNSAGLGLPAGMDSTMNYSWMTTSPSSTTASLIMDRLQPEPLQWNNDGDAPYIPPPPLSASSSITSTKLGLLVYNRQPVLRALSAYNFFFRDERDRIVENDSEGPYDTSSSKKDELLARHWHRDRSKKRRHRKTHGKIAFTDLSKVISKRWKELPNSVKSFYRDVAADDLVRYHKELEDQKASLRPLHTTPPSSSTTTHHPDLY